MAFLRSNLVPEPGPIVRGGRVMLRPPVMADYAAWARDPPAQPGAPDTLGATLEFR